MFFTLFGWRKASQCKKLIKQVQCRLKVLKTKRHSIVKQLREDVAQLIKTGYEDVAFNRAQLLFEDENIMAIYELLDNFCEVITGNLSYIRKHKDCPNDINEAISSLIFASARCGDVPELRALRKLFGERYGQRLAVAALELLPGNLVNFQVKEKLSIMSVPDYEKHRLVDEIAKDYCLRPEILALEYISAPQKQEKEQEEHQLLETDVQTYSCKIEESLAEVSNEDNIEGRGINVDSITSKSSTTPSHCRQNSHTSSTSIISSLVQQSLPEMLEPPNHKKAEGVDTFAGSKLESVALGNEESLMPANAYTTKSEHEEETNMAASSSESLPQFPEEMVVYLDDIEEIKSSNTNEGSCQDQRIFKFKSSPRPKIEKSEDSCVVKHFDPHESRSERSCSSGSENGVVTSVKQSRRRSMSREHSGVKDIECVIYYDKSCKRHPTRRSNLPRKDHKKIVMRKSEQPCFAEKMQKQCNSNHLEAEHCCFCTGDCRDDYEVLPQHRMRGITVIHHCHCSMIGKSDAEMECYGFPQQPRRKSCEFGSTASNLFVSTDWHPDQRSKPMEGKVNKLDSTCSRVSSKDSCPKVINTLTRKETKASYQRAMTMPQERSNDSHRDDVRRCSSFPVQCPTHVHPKLPDCDDIAAKFMALKIEHLENRLNQVV